MRTFAEDLLGGQNCAMTWTVGVPTIAANIKWQCGQNATVDLSCYDATSAVNRLVFISFCRELTN